MPYATLTDVSISLLRDLTSTETSYASALLGRAEALLAALIPALHKRCGIDDYAATVAQVESDMVARVLRNPSGIVSETNGLYSYAVDTAVASGQLAPSQNELQMLRASADVVALAGVADGYARLRYGWTGRHPFLSAG